MTEGKSRPIGQPELVKTTVVSKTRPLIEQLFQDCLRVIPFFLVGWFIIAYSPEFAIWANESALSAWGLVIGGTLIIIGLSHIARRILFPKLDLYVIGLLAEGSPIGAGLVFVGICIVLAKIIEVMAIAIQLR